MITVSSLHLFFKSWKASLDRPWEECRGIGESFGYNRNENLEQYASSEKLIHMLINIVSGGGNLLLNIGPAADGSIPYHAATFKKHG